MPGIHLHDSLLPFSNRFERFGGHARAVGVTIEPSRFEKFVSDYTAYMEKTYAEEVFVPTYTYEQTLRLSSLSVELVEELKLLAPFGEGNPIPRFLLQDVALRDSRKIGKNGEHLDAVASQGETSVRLVGFRQGGHPGDPGDPHLQPDLCRLPGFPGHGGGCPGRRQLRRHQGLR